MQREMQYHQRASADSFPSAFDGGQDNRTVCYTGV